MAKRGSWYFEGYQAETKLEENGKEKRVLVYRGEWYGLGPERRKLLRAKLICLALAAGSTAGVLLLNFFPAQGGRTPWVGGPCLLALVPLMFLWIGLANFLAAGAQWALRTYYAGYRRMRRWTIVLLAATALTAAAQAVYAAGHPWSAAEAFYLLGAVLTAGCTGVMLWFQIRHPATVVRGPEIV